MLAPIAATIKMDLRLRTFMETLICLKQLLEMLSRRYDGEIGLACGNIFRVTQIKFRIS